jgi:sugar O-acyltransferase (sialic acid O-acetyltransferase NeuD family)
MKENIIVFGTGKLAEMVDYYFPYYGYNIVGFTEDGEFENKQFRGKPVLPWRDAAVKWPSKSYKMFVAIGYSDLNRIRAKKYYEVKEKGYQLVSVNCSPNRWNDTQIGDNCLIFENQVLQPNIKIGNDVIIWSANHFGHDVVLGDHIWISSHGVFCGGVEVGEYSFIGVNASLRDDIHIGKKNIISAGALILSDTQDGEVYIADQTEPFRLNSDQFERMMDISGKYGEKLDSKDS